MDKQDNFSIVDQFKKILNNSVIFRRSVSAFL